MDQIGRPLIVLTVIFHLVTVGPVRAAGPGESCHRELGTPCVFGLRCVDGLCICADDAYCDDGLFCNGREVCRPGDSAADSAGCVAPATSPCGPEERCREGDARCVAECPVARDADSDGHDDVVCGGDDCDDSDPNRYPGNPEVCDEHAHDEDCDPTTFGRKDSDGDGYVDAACAN